MSGRIGIDTGGTFTDFVLLDGSGTLRTAKVPSTPGRSRRCAIRGGLAQLAGSDVGRRRWSSGTTVATNAVIQRLGPTVLFVTNAGFRGRAVHRPPRQGAALRPPLAQAEAARPAPPLPGGRRPRRPRRRDRRGARAGRPRAACASGCRPLAGDGVVVAVSCLFSYLEPGPRAGDRRRDPGGRCPTLPISVSHEVSPVWREYERASTTIADAFVKPLIEVYVDRVGAVIREDTGIERWNLLASNGGYLRAEQARRGPGRLLLSGLAGGVIGARFFARGRGQPVRVLARHGRHELRHRPRARGRGAVRERVPGRVGHSGQHPLRRRQHDRRGRRLDRVDRQGRPAPRRAAERGGRAGPGRLRSRAAPSRP